MSNQEFLKIQTCVLKVNIHCDGCKRQVKKILQKIEGVYTVVINSEQGKVTVSGNVDPPTLIKKLAKCGKHAKIDGGGDNKNQGQKVPIQQGQPLQKQVTGGGLSTQQLQLLKGFQDMKSSPFIVGCGKDEAKSLKFRMSESDDDDEFDDDDFDDYEDEEEEEDDDDDDDDDDDELDDIPMKKPMLVGSGGGSRKANMMMLNEQFMKGEQRPLQMMKGVGGASQNKNGGNVNVNDLHGMPNMVGISGGDGLGPMGAFQGLPTGATTSNSRSPSGYLQGLGGEPMAGNPHYQQQLRMNQQRVDGNEKFKPMMYARPPPGVNYMQPPYHGEPLTHYFGDDNTSSCNVM